MPLQQIQLDTHNLCVGDRLKSKGRPKWDTDRRYVIGDAQITSIEVVRGACLYTVQTFVWQSAMKMNFAELCEFFHEATRGQRDGSEPN